MKFFRMPARNFLVHRFDFTHKEAVECIAKGRLIINGVVAGQQQEVHETDLVLLDGQVIFQGKHYFYIAYHKPRGVECTMNKDISNNLIEATGLDEEFFPVGRLDKASEGLLLLTNDGFLCDSIIGNDKGQEKEYEVKVDKAITDEALVSLSEGVMVMGQLTMPAKVVRIDENSFKIILVQGLNRQIRRMCYKVGYEVQTLKRTRIVNIELNDLEPEKWRYLEEFELNELKRIVNY